MGSSTIKTLLVALGVSFVCSVLVSLTSVVLKERQKTNERLSIESKIIGVADLDKAASFEDFKELFVSLKSGCVAEEIEGYSVRRALLTDQLSDRLSKKDDIAGIVRQEHYTNIYVYGDLSNPEVYIFPVRGYGLWGTMYAFIALENDLSTVRGIQVYQHKETPGLGGEVENPKWRALWRGKKLFEGDQVVLSVIKGQVSEQTPMADRTISGLAGATLTTKGIDNMLKYWFSEQAFAPVRDCLKNMQTQQRAVCGGLNANDCSRSATKELS